MSIAAEKLSQYEKILEENTYLSKEDLPGKLDSEVMLAHKSKFEI